MDIFQQTFRIGEFANFARVTIKMLRHYDRLGLLKPAAVDPETNYRYYSAEQLPRLNRIISLKDLGFSLDQVAQILQDGFSPEELRGMLKYKRAEIKAQILADQARLNLIEAHISQLTNEDRAAQYAVVIRPVAAQLVAAVRKTIDSAEIGQLFDLVEGYAARFKARANLPPLAVAHQRSDQHVDVEVMIPLNQAIPTSPPIQIYELPAVDQMACVVHSGPYPEMRKAYEAFFDWMAINDYQTIGRTRIVYLRFGAAESGYQLPASFVTDDSQRYVTELQFPVEKLRE